MHIYIVIELLIPRKIKAMELERSGLTNLLTDKRHFSLRLALAIGIFYDDTLPYLSF